MPQLTHEQISAAMSGLAPALQGTQHELFFREHEPRYRFVLGLVGGPPRPGARLLDAGASPGHVSALCQSLGWKVAAVDRFPRQAFPPRTGAPHLNLFEARGIHAVEMDITAGPLPFVDGAFDAVLFNETLEHLVGSPMGAMKEFARVLAPGGRLTLTTPNVASLRNRAAFVMGRNIYTNLETAINVHPYKCHNREYTLAEAADLVRRAGLRPVRAGRANVGPPPRDAFHTAARSLYYAATWLWPPGRSMIFIVAEKPGA